MKLFKKNEIEFEKDSAQLWKLSHPHFENKAVGF